MTSNEPRLDEHLRQKVDPDKFKGLKEQPPQESLT